MRRWISLSTVVLGTIFILSSISQVAGANALISPTAKQQECKAPWSYRDTLTFSPDSRYVMAGWGDGPNRLRVWDVETGQRVDKFVDDSNHVSLYAEFSPDGKYVLSYNDSEAILWDFATGIKVRTFQFPKRLYDPWSRPPQFSADGKQVLLTDSDGGYLWDVQTGQLIDTFPEIVDGYIKLSPNGKFIWIRTNDVEKHSPMISVWNVENHMRVAILGWEAAFSPDGRFIFVVELDDLGLYDLNSMRRVHIIDYGEQADWDVLYSPDGRVVALELGIYVWDVSNAKMLYRIPTTDASQSQFSSTGKYLFVVDGGGNQTSQRTFRLWDVKENREIKQFPLDNKDEWSHLVDFAYSPDDKLMVGRYQGEDGLSIRLWNLEKERYIQLCG